MEDVALVQFGVAPREVYYVCNSMKTLTVTEAVPEILWCEATLRPLANKGRGPLVDFAKNRGESAAWRRGASGEYLHTPFVVQVP